MHETKSNTAKNRMQPSADNHNIRRAAHLASLGRFSHACAALVKEGMAPVNQENLEALKEEHPTADRPVLQPATDTPLGVNSIIVLEQLKSFIAGSTGGYDGLRPQHILEGVKSSQNRPPLNTLTAFVNWLLAGKFPDDIAVYFAGAPLLACNKKGGGIRPLAIRGAIRRLDSKCACNALKDRFESYLSPIQLGVGVRGGAETMINVLDHQIDSNKETDDYVILKIASNIG